MNALILLGLTACGYNTEDQPKNSDVNNKPKSTTIEDIHPQAFDPDKFDVPGRYSGSTGICSTYDKSQFNSIRWSKLKENTVLETKKHGALTFAKDTFVYLSCEDGFVTNAALSTAQEIDGTTYAPGHDIPGHARKTMNGVMFSEETGVLTLGTPLENVTIEAYECIGNGQSLLTRNKDNSLSGCMLAEAANFFSGSAYAPKESTVSGIKNDSVKTIIFPEGYTLSNESESRSFKPERLNFNSSGEITDGIGTIEEKYSNENGSSFVVPMDAFYNPSNKL